MKANGINIKKMDSFPDRQWLVSVAPSVFGKQIRKRFKTRRQAELQAHTYAMKTANKEVRRLLILGNFMELQSRPGS